MEFPASTLWCCRGQRLQMVSSTFKVVISTNSQATSHCTDSVFPCGIHRQVFGLFHRCKYYTSKNNPSPQVHSYWLFMRRMGEKKGIFLSELSKATRKQ